ncbi:hypothetical protein TWF281_001415 [Arthrobotrys megalospora]
MHRIDGMACCGIYYIPVGTYTPQPLPLLSLTTEITLTPTYSRTVLKQHFKNPSPKDAISEANYVFPLHPTQTITSFTCHVGEDKTLNGIVQSKPKAKATYDAAVSRGETAGLLSWAASDVWQSKLGNVPAGASIEVIITCVAQLQHDSEKDAIRFNLPTYIASRYGAPPQEVYDGNVSYSYRLGKRGRGSWCILRGPDNWVDIDGGMNIKVFVEMDSPIKMVEAPAHATNLSMGTHSASDSSDDFDPKKALLTLSSETTALDKDFVVLVKTARSGHPSAVVQRHPTKDIASLMLTLVPKFNMPIARPEVVFICDRSGSMSGNEVQLRKALAVFLQSLPVGCKFNICSFGSSHSFLWDKSKTYSEQTLKEAQNHVSKFEADMGGTEMYPPVKAAIERRYKDLNLELLLLTDGDIWQRDQLMDYVREQCKAKTIRMFTLGIGNGISHALIDGLASVGGGYSQVVQLEEKLDSKVVRMLRAALGQHVSDYTLELTEPGTAATASDEDEYDMLGDAEPEKMVISGKKEVEPKPEPKKISLFDTSAELDPPPEYESKDTDEARWAHLPPLPKLPVKIQSPHVIPPLFSFSRTNAYVVFSPCPKTFPKSAKLQAKTISGDILELEIPVLKVDDGKDVSQLAARSFLQELEDGKGYLHEGLLSAEGFTKEKQESKWDEIIEREGVRWGEGFGVASKWTSFVAIEDKTGKEAASEEKAAREAVAEEQSEGGGGSQLRRKMSPPSGMRSQTRGSPVLLQSLSVSARSYSKKKSAAPSLGLSSFARSAKSAVTGMFGGNSAPAPARDSSFSASYASAPPPPPPPGGNAFAGPPRPTASMSAFGAPPPPPPPQSRARMSAAAPSIPITYSRTEDDELEEEIGGLSTDLDLLDQEVLRSNIKLVERVAESFEYEEDLLDYSDDEIDSSSRDRSYEANYHGTAPLSAASPQAVLETLSFYSVANTYDSESKKERKSSSSMKKSAKSLLRRSSPPKMSGDAYALEAEEDDEEDEDMGFGLVEESRNVSKGGPPVSVGTAEERIHGLIMLQSFSGSFAASDNLGKIIEASLKGASDVLKKLKELAKTLGVKEEIVATWAAVLVFEKGEGHAAERDTWELVVEKAVMWVEGEGSGEDVKEKVRGAIGA